MRQVVLDTETTGLEPEQNHRIIEIGCVEIVDRKMSGRSFHCYINPDREIDEGALEVHGISNEFLRDKPRFAEIAGEFCAFIEGAELLIHNAPFDVGFLDHEFRLDGERFGPTERHATVVDTLQLARAKHPGQKNSLDALCKRYEVDNSQRDLHGALLDAQLLADVYLLMTGGQTRLSLGGHDDEGTGLSRASRIRRLDSNRAPLPVPEPTPEEQALHQQWLEKHQVDAW